ncbi:MAG TPA: 4-hydroxy-3-methylbut-2-enyl diphosphate reductase [Candidatus Saccharimonadales bacterium]|nr:4-hydroxy-3-methylbut-2-enyl diphosphate reductase [Candidatus Saccharimonadales bacterium]
MKITLGKHSGFCFGVKRAYDLTCVNSKDCDDVYILGKLVHNNNVCQDLYKRGIKEIKLLSDIKEGTVIFTAHGVGPGFYEKASARGLKIIDTTCPKVMKAQRLAKSFAEKKYQVLIFGDKNHKEVKSIFEWSGRHAKIVGSLAEAEKLKLDKAKKYCLVAQTTQNVEEFKKIIAYFQKNLKNFVYFNTICPSTDDRQKEVRELAKSNEAVIVIGGKDSANSRMLYEIAKSINPKSYFVENVGQLKKSWFSDIKKIAVSAGASTPEWVIEEVIGKINSYT